MFERTVEKFLLLDFLADSGAAEMYTADKHKMAVSPQQKVISVLHHGKQISYSRTKTLLSGIWRTSAWKTVGTVSKDR